MVTTTTDATASTPNGTPAGQPASKKKAKGRGLAHYVSFRNIGAIYVWIAIIIVFSIWAPDTFPTWQTAKTVLNQNAVSGLVALALIVPLSSRVFDLSVGNAVGLCNVIVAWLLVNQGMPMGFAILLTIIAGILIGVANGIVVIGWKIDSFIATLATGSLMAALTSLVSDNKSIIGPQLGGTFSDISTTGIGGISIPVFMMLGVAALLWYLLNYTVAGRRIYATGFNEAGARLTGIKTSRLRFTSLIVSGTVAGIGGILLASQVSAGSPEIGPPYLLSAFAAAFLGATQFGGRFNAWGTVIAVLLLGTGKSGLLLVGAPVWAPNMFVGVVLLFALALTNFDRSLDVRGYIARARNRRGGGTGSDAAVVTGKAAA
jgi:ribose transport system permease protein